MWHRKSKEKEFNPHVSSEARPSELPNEWAETATRLYSLTRVRDLGSCLLPSTDGAFSTMLPLFVFLTFHPHQTLHTSLEMVPLTCPVSDPHLLAHHVSGSGWPVLHRWAQCTNHINSVCRAECMQNETSVSHTGWNINDQKGKKKVFFFHLWENQTKLILPLLTQTPVQKQ